MKGVKKYAFVGAIVGAFGLLSAADADAQVCVGFPTVGGQMAAAASTNFITGGNQFGGEFNYNFGGLSAFAGLNYTEYDNVDASVTSAGGGVAVDFAPLTAALPAGISACPAVAIVVADVEDTGILVIPVGVGFGTTLALGETRLSLSPYVVPQVRFRTGDDDDNKARFLLSGGALLNITPVIYAGATVNRIFVENAESEFGIKIGVVF